MAAALDISAMSSLSFLEYDSQNFYASSGNSAADASEQSVFELSDYVVFNESSSTESLTLTAVAGDVGGHGSTYCPRSSAITNCGNDTKRTRVDVGCRIGFRMKSEVEILDDGFKWRKYGKKSVKNSPNPRNYYRCSSQGCGVKKRVERDREDSSYVITIYEGVHNHISPGRIY